MHRMLVVAPLCLTVLLLSGCAYSPSVEQQRAQAAMTTERAVQIVAESLQNGTDGLGICAVPGWMFNEDTRTPRFHSASATEFKYLDNKGGGGCTNNCPDPNHLFVVRYADIKRIFIAKTKTQSLCRQGPGFDVIQIVAKHEDRNTTMTTVRSERLPEVLAAYKYLNPSIALKSSY